jgi:hypothetical protein
MPQGDGTGPMGQGPMTGRGMGYCAGFNMPGFANAGFGRGLRRGFGRGFGFRRFPQSVELTAEQERKILEAELAEVEAEKKELEKALKKTK